MSHDTDRVMADIQAERKRQQFDEGWTPEHDDAHADGEMARAAACYAHIAGSSDRVRDHERLREPHQEASSTTPIQASWPWDWKWWKPKTRRADMVRAAALLVAKIERIDRATVKRMAAKLASN